MKSLTIHEGVIRPALVEELEAFRTPDRKISSYYVNLEQSGTTTAKARQIAVKNVFAEVRRRIDELDIPKVVSRTLHADWDQIKELALVMIGRHGIQSLACFVASDSRYGRALGLPWLVRDRVFFEDHFVVWPLRHVLGQADHYAICLTDKDEARLFRYFFGQMDEVADIFDDIPGRVRLPSPLDEHTYQNKHIEYFHRHFERVGEVALRFFQREPFEHFIIGGLWETLPAFEGRLHHHLRDRIVARWDIDVHTPAPRILERVRQEEVTVLDRQARNIWGLIRDHRPQRAALRADHVFAALWQRRVQALLVQPGAVRPGARCSKCGRVQSSEGQCVECGAETSSISNAYDEAIHDAVDQSAQIRHFNDPVLKEFESMAAFTRF